MLLFLSEITIDIHSQTWIRPVTPVVDGVYSQAVAWASKRDDGSPYAITTKLFDLGLTHKSGYTITVSYTRLFDS